MSYSSLDTQLDFLEAQFKELADSLLDGSSARVQSAGAALQKLAVEFVQTADELGHAQLLVSNRVLRLKTLASGIATVRESLLRQSAYVDRALELVVPAAQPQATYAGSRTYGGPVRQSGAFAVLAA